MDYLKPFLGLLKSRKFQTALIALLGVVLAEYSGLSRDMQAAIVALAASVIIGIAAEDAAAKRAA